MKRRGMVLYQGADGTCTSTGDAGLVRLESLLTLDGALATSATYAVGRCGDGVSLAV